MIIGLKLLGNRRRRSNPADPSIRMGAYRIGFIFENETIELVRVLGRKEIYKYFP